MEENYVKRGVSGLKTLIIQELLGALPLDPTRDTMNH